MLNVILDETHREKKFRLGKILTIIDGSIADQEQRKALKDIIIDSYWPSYKNDSFMSSLQNILLEFAEKFCEEFVPKTNDDLRIFGREIGDEAPPVRTNYFNQ